jgi:hypothetical protein
MRFRPILLIPLILLSLLASGLIAHSAAAAPAPLASSAYVPIVLRGQALSQSALQTTPIVLVAKDSGLASLVVMRDTRPGALPGALCFFVATATRPDYCLRVAEDVDGHLVDLLPENPAITVAPSDSDLGVAWSPDRPKQGRSRWSVFLLGSACSTRAGRSATPPARSTCGGPS